MPTATAVVFREGGFVVAPITTELQRLGICASCLGPQTWARCLIYPVVSWACPKIIGFETAAAAQGKEQHGGLVRRDT